MSAFWLKWATGVMLALRVGSMELFEQLIGLAFAVALATLDLLGIQYGARLA